MKLWRALLISLSWDSSSTQHPCFGQEHIQTFGMILSVDVVHGAQTPMCFTPETAHFLVYGTITKMSEKEMLGAIPDAEIQDKLQKVCLGQPRV